MPLVKLVTSIICLKIFLNSQKPYAEPLRTDQLALLPVTQRFAVLEEGDVVQVTRTEVNIIDASGKDVEREIGVSNISSDATGKAG